MSVVAPATLHVRVEHYVEQADDPSLAEVLGYFQLNPAESSDERTLVESVLSGIEQLDASDAEASEAEA